MKCRPFPLNQGRPVHLIPWLPFDKSGGICLNWILRIVKEIILTGRDLRICLRPIGAYAPVGVIYVEMWWSCGGFGWRSGLDIPHS